MDISKKLENWANVVKGIGLDVDKAYGNQCADVDLSWGIYLFPGIHWSVLFRPTTSAKDMFDKVNPDYFDKIVNDHNDPNQLPQPGDVIFFAASPEKGYASTYRNDDGHTGVVAPGTNSNRIMLYQQDGSTKQTVVQLVARSWRYTRCIGWARPKQPQAIPAAAQVTGPVTDPRIGKRLFLHPVSQWSVYRRGQYPDRAKRIGYLIPRNYSHGPQGQPGLTYVIEGVSSYPNTVSITTDTYGPVDIYVDGDAEII